MRCGALGVERPHFRRHEPLGTIAVAHQDAVARLQLGEAVTADGFHVQKNVLGPLARA